ncbi:pimeloyl-ACP methyl ester carboxylesterase [Kibdelosporangium banguiense]|uniref:Pimeloyl-ACP methyl ester carboxylesterase n=1 Tax=Kibdelosporangium banguiense TaxID=1365924 RepID=A0ABS4TUS2_9PSEU|nr:alpha/beta hydrolase [Kibdelosporangium banguiense]MBP2328171.1 pimeloyl-ACP methyl ester carboxylesterase [Kibdelosporangium banguiense]
MRLLRGTTALVCTLTVVLAETSSAGAAGAGSSSVARPVSSIDWRPCGEHPALDCATVHMPIDWANPAGQTVPIAVARAKAAKPEQRKGVLMVNPGGPGGSGVDYAFDISENHALSQTLLDNFDIIGFDPRGVSRSAQLKCDDGVLNETWPWQPKSEKDFGEVLAHNDRVAQSCIQHNGALANHVDTTSVVRDMDALRELLGENTISYYGKSYGTQVGQQYAELFGPHLRALVLDSNMDHSAGVADSLVPENLALEQSFTDFAAWCQRTTSCVLHDRDVLVLWDDLYAKATAGKLGWIKPSDLREKASWAMYTPVRWPSLAEFLKSAAEGTPTTRSARSTNTDDDLSKTTQPIWCSDWQWREANSYAALSTYRTQAEAVAPHTRLTPFYGDILACLGWSGAVNNPQRPLRVPHAPPILMTNSLRDVATPYQWAQNVASQLPTATLLTYDGTGHGNYQLSTCARAAIDAYLLTVRTPAPGTHCPAEWPTGESTDITHSNAPTMR